MEIKAGEKHRIRWVDIAKGIGIILTIIGHSSSGILRGAIYSFHMPLFFILSARTFDFSKTKEEYVTKTERVFKHLIIPTLFIFLTKSIVIDHSAFLSMDLKGLKDYLASRVNILVYSSGVNVGVGKEMVLAIGIPWFFVVLLIGRTLYDYLHLVLSPLKFNVFIALCSVLGFVFGHIQWLPVSFDIVLFIMPFFRFGTYLKKVDLNKNFGFRLFLAFFAWGALLAASKLLFSSYMELACRRYTFYPICYCIAIAGTMYIFYFSVFLSEAVKRLSDFLEFVGRNSIFLLCIHALDFTFQFAYCWANFYGGEAIFRTMLDLLVLYAALSIKKAIHHLLMYRKAAR